MHFLTISNKEIHRKPLEIKNLEVSLVYCEEIGLKSAQTAPGGPFKVELKAKFVFAMNRVHSVPRDSPREGDQQNQQTVRTAHTPVAPGQPPRDPGICSQ